MRKFTYLLAATLVALAAPGCDILNQWGNAWCTAANNGGGGDDGSGDGGDDTGNGGDTSEDGLGGASTDPGTGIDTGTGTSTDPGAGTGTDPGTPTDPGERHPSRHRRRRWRSPRLGTAVQAECGDPGTSIPTPPPSFPAWAFPPIPTPIPVPMSAIPLTTTRLRAVCTAQGIGAGKTGIQFSQDCGIQFQKWVQWMLQMPQYTTPMMSQARQKANQGLPASVIPDYVTNLKVAVQGQPTVFVLPASFFGEVKAVAGNLTLQYSKSQILGLLDVARQSAAGSSPLPNHPPPEVVFTTTGNTIIPDPTKVQATAWGVAIWQQIVYEDPAAGMPNDPNPDLCINYCEPLNESVYPPGLTLEFYRLNSTCTKLTAAPANWANLIQGDPDPPTVDP